MLEYWFLGSPDEALEPIITRGNFCKEERRQTKRLKIHPAISTSEGLPVNKKQSHVLWTDLLELKIGIILLQFHPDLLRSRSLRQVPAEEL